MSLQGRAAACLIFLIGLVGISLCASGTSWAKDEEHLIHKVKELGAIIILEDGSEWDVPNPLDQDKAYDWLPGAQVLVRKGGKEILHVNSGDRVDVKLTKKADTTAKAAPAEDSGQTASLPPLKLAPPKADSDMELKIKALERRLEDMNVKMKVMELKIMRLESMSGMQP